jgi:CheY-like chemotaxis protein
MNATVPPESGRQWRRRVLVVEDDGATRRALQRLLEDDGYEVDTAIDGADGLEKALACPPDVVLSDVQMPRMDGLTLAQHLSARFAALPIVLMSSDLAVADRAPTVAAFLPKPLDLEALENALDQACAAA